MAEECVYDYHDSGYRCERERKKRSCPTTGILKRMTLPPGGRFWGADRKDHFHTSPSRHWIAGKKFSYLLQFRCRERYIFRKRKSVVSYAAKRKDEVQPRSRLFSCCQPCKTDAAINNS